MNDGYLKVGDLVEWHYLEPTSSIKSLGIIVDFCDSELFSMCLVLDNDGKTNWHSENTLFNVNYNFSQFKLGNKINE